MNIREILSELTLQEKMDLLTGKDMWATVEIERLGIPSIRVSDGPHGVRKEYLDEYGEKKTHKAICFPTASALAATWNPELVYEAGKALANECAHLEVDVLLGPGTNIKRTPVCGRNFEYFSEDPLLAGELAAAYIKGVQELGISTCLKHFAANNQEVDRMCISSEVSERALREIYFKPFEIAIKKAHPWTIMCAYNRLNGVYCSENKWLLKDILREEFGFEGVVISDWWAVHDRAKALASSLELQMPYTEKSLQQLKSAYEKGEISEEQIDEALKGLLDFIFKIQQMKSKRQVAYNLENQRELAKQAACEAVILLKNEDNVLPIQKDKVKRIAVIGQYAEYPIIQGAGSACVNSEHIESAIDKIKELAGDTLEVAYNHGYSIWTCMPGSEVLGDAVMLANESDKAVIFVGNNEKIEAESFDRSTLKLTPDIENMILRIAEQNPETIVVIQAGSVIDMSSWIHKVKGVVFAGYAGQASGSAVAEILFGHVNPSGKTAETFPMCLEDTPAYPNYPGNGFATSYKEDLMVGYRHYDSINKQVLFPFGHGLSYTTFEYSDMRLSSEDIKAGETINVTVKIRNTGDREGKETVQLYVRDVVSRVIRPFKELKGFSKLHLAPNEEKEVRFVLGKEAFSYYNTCLKKWHIESGVFEILVGASSRDIRESKKVRVTNPSDFS